MARVVIEIVDGVGDQIGIKIKSQDPPIPIKDGEPDADNLTNAQAAALLAVMEVAGEANTAALFIEDEE